MIAKTDIEEQQLSTLSLMPVNVSEILNPDEFEHLMAFLLTQQKKPQE